MSKSKKHDPHKGRIIKGKPEKHSYGGRKRNCQHKWSDNQASNVWTDSTSIIVFASIIAELGVVS